MSYGVFGKAFWWQAEKDPHEVISKFIQVLRDEQDSYYNDIETFMGLYNGRPLHSRYAQGSMQYSLLRQPRLTFNIIHSLCQAATSKIAKHRPAVSFLTEGGNYSQKRKSQLFGKLMQGQFYSMKMYPVAQKVFLDACITGTGVIKYYTEFDKIKAERVPIHEITIDPIEAETGNMPRQMFQTKKVSRHVLAEMFPEKKDQIITAANHDDDEYEEDERFSDMILCHEAWHLPSGPEAKDGRHVICINDVTLLDDVWEKDHFPFTFIRWTENPTSFWGNGLAREIKGIQVEINKLLARIQEQMHLATPKIFIEDSSKIVQSHLNNRVFGAIKYRGTPPQFFVPRAVGNDMFAHLDRLVERAYEMTGISQLAAQSKKPAGLESGRALREFSDIESERFMVVGQAYEQLFLDASEQIINLIRDAYHENNSYIVSAFNHKSGLEKIKWSEINLENDEYIIQVKPIGSLPQTPSAKLASVAEMHMNGFFSTEEAHQLLDFPDLEKANRMKTAFIDIIDKIIENILEKSKYTPPESYMNLEFGIARMQQAYNMSMLDDTPNNKLELIRRWISQANGLLSQQKVPAPGQAAGAPGPMAPGGMPLPPGLAPPPMGAMAPPPGLPPGMPPMGPPLGPGMAPPQGTPAIPPELAASLGAI
tara:strand:- start:17602 stop:19551 length:1950 start_codon:yes stop_codon:yes gene_type:complete